MMGSGVCWAYQLGRGEGNKASGGILTPISYGPAATCLRQLAQMLKTAPEIGGK